MKLCLFFTGLILIRKQPVWWTGGKFFFSVGIICSELLFFFSNVHISRKIYQIGNT